MCDERNCQRHTDHVRTFFQNPTWLEHFFRHPLYEYEMETDTLARIRRPSYPVSRQIRFIYEELLSNNDTWVTDLLHNNMNKITSQFESTWCLYVTLQVGCRFASHTVIYMCTYYTYTHRPWDRRWECIPREVIVSTLGQRSCPRTTDDMIDASEELRSGNHGLISKKRNRFQRVFLRHSGKSLKWQLTGNRWYWKTGL